MFQAKELIMIRSGVLVLTDDQARRRASCLMPSIKAGAYTVTAPVQIKAGEVFGINGDVDKYLADRIINLDPKVNASRRKK